MKNTPESWKEIQLSGVLGAARPSAARPCAARLVVALTLPELSTARLLRPAPPWPAAAAQKPIATRRRPG